MDCRAGQKVKFGGSVMAKQSTESNLLENLKEAVDGLKSLERILKETNPCKYCNFNPRFPEEDVPYLNAEYYKKLNDTIDAAEKELLNDA